MIKRIYTPLLTDIYTFDSKFLSPEFATLPTTTKNITQVGKGLFTYPVFTKEFCKMFLTELKHFKKQDVPHRQPNSMNKHGILLDDILGFSNFFDEFRTNYMQAIVRKLFPDLYDIELDSQKGKGLSYFSTF